MRQFLDSSARQIFAAASITTFTFTRLAPIDRMAAVFSTLGQMEDASDVFACWLLGFIR